LAAPAWFRLPTLILFYASIAEEYGLLGAIGLLIVFAILAVRGIEIALHAPNHYQRFLQWELPALTSFRRG